MYKLINVYMRLFTSTLNVGVIINFPGIFRGHRPQLQRCNIYEVPKHRILPEFMTRHGVFVQLCIIYEWKEAFVDVLLLPISSDQTDIVSTEIAEKKERRETSQRENMYRSRPYENSHAISNPASGYHLSVDKCRDENAASQMK